MSTETKITYTQMFKNHKSQTRHVALADNGAMKRTGIGATKEEAKEKAISKLIN